VRRYRTVVAEAYERLCQLAHPAGGQDSPVVGGAVLGTWIVSAGIGAPVGAEVVELLYPQAMDTGMHAAAQVTEDALRRMTREGLVEGRRSGGAFTWRPVPGKGLPPA
jgi:hypothetical protein